jgi:periplasmic protein TonB
MTAQSLLILPGYDGAELRRWAFAAAFVVTAHVAAVGVYLWVAPDEAEGASDTPAVFVDLKPTAASSPSSDDITPGPEMSEAVQMPKPPPQTKPEVADPIEKIEAPAEVTLPMPEPKAEQQKPKEEPDTQKTKVEDAQQTETLVRTAPRAEQQKQIAARPSSAIQGSNASRDATVRWNHLASARLQQNKRYPSGAVRGEQGTVEFSFVVNSKGQVLSQRIVRSSGHRALDDEALAMIQRAQPLPAFLPGMMQQTMEVNSSVGYTVQ